MAFNFNNFKKFDFNSVLNFAIFGLLKQKKLISEIIILFLILFSFCVLGLLAFVSLVMAVSFFMDSNLIIFAIFPLIFGLLFLVLAGICSIYFSYRIVSFALVSIGKKYHEFSIKLAIKLILSGIVAFFVSVFSIYELKLLWIGIIGFILFLFGIVLVVFYNGYFLMLILGVLAIVVACVSFLVYYVIMVRNFVRTSFASVLLIEKNLGVREAVKSSWNLTSGKAVLIFIIQLILGGITWVLSQIVFLPLNVLVLPFGAESFSGANLLFVLLFIFIFFLVLFIIMIISELFVIFGQVAIYRQISVKKK